MKEMTKYPIVFVLVAFLIGGLLQYYQSQLDQNMIVVLSNLFEKGIESFRNLSLHSWYGNIFAWGLFIIICWLPMVFAIYVYKEKKKDKTLLFVSLIISIINMGLLYGVLNYKFINDMFYIAPDLFMQVIYFAISLIVLVLVIAWWFVYVLQDLYLKLRLIQNFQIILLIYMILLAILSGYNITQVISTILNQTDQSVILILDLFGTIPQLLIVALLWVVFKILEMMKIDLLNINILPKLNHTKLISIAVVVTSLVIPLVSGLIQLLFITQIDNVNISINIPFTELIVALVLLLINEILRTSIALKEENKQFI